MRCIYGIYEMYIWYIEFTVAHVNEQHRTCGNLVIMNHNSGWFIMNHSSGS